MGINCFLHLKMLKSHEYSILERQMQFGVRERSTTRVLQSVKLIKVPQERRWKCEPLSMRYGEGSAYPAAYSSNASHSIVEAAS